LKLSYFASILLTYCKTLGNFFMATTSWNQNANLKSPCTPVSHLHGATISCPDRRKDALSSVS